ncbi:hypothetical protein E4T56_gene15477, partial [Termitomyces sp. T112]
GCVGLGETQVFFGKVVDIAGRIFHAVSVEGAGAGGVAGSAALSPRELVCAMATAGKKMAGRANGYGLAQWIELWPARRRDLRASGDRVQSAQSPVASRLHREPDIGVQRGDL